LRFYHDVININLEVAPYLLFEAKIHTKHSKGVMNMVVGWFASARSIW
jgi:hypothetical protein